MTVSAVGAPAAVGLRSGLSPTAAGAMLAALTPVVVLAADPWGWQPFGPTKWLAVTGLTLAAVATIGRRARLARAPLLAWGVFLGWVALAAVTALDGRYAWVGTPERHFGVLTWVLCALVFACGQALRGDDARLVMAGAVAAGGGVSLWVAAEVMGRDPIAIADAGGRLAGPLGSAAFLGAAGCLLLPLTAGVAADGGTRRWVRVVALLCATGLVVAVAGSGTRAAWLGLGVAAVVALAVRGRGRVRHRRRPGRAVLLAVLLAAGAIAIAAAATPVGGRIVGVFDADSAGGRGRVDEWRVALRVVRAHPIVGVGPEGYRLAFAEGVDAAYERAHGRDPLPDRAHDALLDVAVTIGIPGVLAYLALIIVVGRHVWRARRRGPPWLAGVALGLVAYAVQSLFLFPVSELDPVAWLLAGLVVGATASEGELVRVRIPRAVAVVSAALAAIALALGVLDVAADRHAKQALDRLAGGDPAGAARLADRAASLRPDVVRYHLVAARAATTTDGALARVDDALAVAPRDPIVRQQRAALLLRRAAVSGLPADAASARAALEALVAADPVHAALRLDLGVAAARAGDLAAAEAQWRAAQDLAPRRAAPSVNLARLYLSQDRVAEARVAAERAVAIAPDDAAARAVLADAVRRS